MKVSRLLIVAALAASCGRGATSDRSDQTPNEQAPPVATSGDTTQSALALPPAQVRAATPGTTPIADEAKATNVNPDAAVNQDFKTRIDAYMKLRKEAVRDAPALKETKDPAKIKAAQDAMSMQIRAARATAKQG